MSFHTGAMKAIARAPRSLSNLLTPLAATLALAACVPPPRTETPLARAPAPAPARQRPATPLPQPTDWRDAPLTPGTWQWNATATGSTATFAGGQLTIRCNPRAATISLIRAGAAPVAPASAAFTITTTQTVRTLRAAAMAGAMEVTLPARDPLLDAMAFSRGRFALAATGAPILYVPSWAEVSRVIEDCR